MLARVPLIEGVRVDIFQVCFSPGLLLLLSQLLPRPLVGGGHPQRAGVYGVGLSSNM